MVNFMMKGFEMADAAFTAMTATVLKTTKQRMMIAQRDQ
jgi:hypothetical protein